MNTELPESLPKKKPSAEVIEPARSSRKLAELRGGGRYLRLGGQRGWCVRKHAHARWVWGHAPPEIFFKIRCSEIASEAIFVPKCH